jgi:hypothetical protein
VEEALPEQDEVARVAQVVAATGQADYWVSASMDGNREEHYRGECARIERRKFQSFVHENKSNML